MHKAFDWKHSRIFTLEMEAPSWSYIPYVQISLSFTIYMSILFLVESFNLCPSNQYIFVRVIRSYFCFAKMCLHHISLLSSCSPRYFTSSSWGSCILFIWAGRGPNFPLCGECYMDQFESVSFYSQFIHQVWVAAMSVCSFCKKIAVSLPMASTAALSAKFALVKSGNVGKPAVYSRHDNSPRTLPWGKPTLTGESYVYTISTFTHIPSLVSLTRSQHHQFLCCLQAIAQ
jgi:hypothetical protein